MTLELSVVSYVEVEYEETSMQKDLSA
jgi:hypothetical protein